jgi:CheY-like chemotaxis protein
MRYDSAHDAILIVEDEALLREVETYMFEDAGYRVFTAETADDAAHFLREHDKINVLFTDVNMPGSMSGNGPCTIRFPTMATDRHRHSLGTAAGRRYPVGCELSL